MVQPCWFIEKLASKGINKFIAYKLPMDTVREKYGNYFTMVLNDPDRENDLRVLDYNGHNVFCNFSFEEMRAPTRYEP